MKKSKSSDEEVTDCQLIEDISQIKQFALGEGAGVCKVCGTRFREGDDIVVVAFRVADRASVRVDHAKCLECRHEPTEFFTRGTRDIVVEGRVGLCTDAAKQSSWRVLLAPEMRVVSPAGSMAAKPGPGATWFRKPIARSDVFEHVGTSSEKKPWQRPAVRVAGEDDPTGDDTELQSACRASLVKRQGGVRER